jgi:hypothetical protein
MGLSVAWIELDRAVEHAKRLLGARVRVLAVEEHPPDDTLPGVQALRRLPFQTLVLSRIDVRLNAADHAVRT